MWVLDPPSHIQLDVHGYYGIAGEQDKKSELVNGTSNWKLQEDSIVPMHEGDENKEDDNSLSVIMIRLVSFIFG